MGQTDQLAELLTFVQADSRICPRPIDWNEFYKKVGGKRTDLQDPWRVIWEPEPPLILSAWSFSTDEDKILRLIEQIQWAEEHGYLNIADKFLRGLAIESWHHSDPTKPHY